MGTAIALPIFLLFLLPWAQGQKESESKTNEATLLQYPIGDARRCMALNKQLLRFEALPGGGWDNLRNKDQGMIVQYNYSQCLTTDDGRYLLPDGVFTVPLKSSKMETFAELITHWSNYTSTLSRSVNAHAGLNLHNVGISGSFSYDFESVKSHQYFDKAATTRIQVRYVRYTSNLLPDTQLHPVFRARLRKLAAHVILNRTESARYESQLIVRDFGTHVLTSIDVGAALVQVDQLSSTFVRDKSKDKSTITASAGASFFSVFDFGVDYSQSTSHELVTQYLKNRESSRVLAFGGPTFKPKNFSANDWISGIENDLVALDRTGDPIHYVITPAALPDVPPTVVRQVYEIVKEAVKLYYKHNTYPGCTKEDSPNFSFQANFDDGSCLPVNTNYSFGGVYQQCSHSGYTNLCANREQKNPLTGGLSCPENYEPILLKKGTMSSSQTRHECHSCWLVFHCCNDNTYTAQASYSAYWCAAKTSSVPQNSGFLFGGLYTSTVTNPMTRSMSCPDKFYPLHLLESLVVCVSDDYELGWRYSLPFGGFFSCASGNPLSIRKNIQSTKRSTTVGALTSFIVSSGPSAYPHNCPEGYSQHLAVVEHSCEINYCVKSGAFDQQSLPRIHRPPFMTAPRDQTDEKTGDGVVLTADGNIWASESDGQDQIDAYLLKHSDSVSMPPAPKRNTNGNSGNDTMPTGATVAITVLSTIIGIAAGAMILSAFKKRRKRNVYHSIDGSSSSRQPNAYHEWPQATVSTEA